MSVCGLTLISLCIQRGQQTNHVFSIPLRELYASQKSMNMKKCVPFLFSGKISVLYETPTSHLMSSLHDTHTYQYIYTPKKNFKSLYVCLCPHSQIFTYIRIGLRTGHVFSVLWKVYILQNETAMEHVCFLFSRPHFQISTHSKHRHPI